MRVFINRPECSCTILRLCASPKDAKLRRALAYVKEQLGSHSIQIAVDIYGHFVPGGNHQAMDRRDGLENETIHDPDATGALNTVSKRGRSA